MCFAKLPPAACCRKSGQGRQYEHERHGDLDEAQRMIAELKQSDLDQKPGRAAELAAIGEALPQERELISL